MYNIFLDDIFPISVILFAFFAFVFIYFSIAPPKLEIFYNFLG
jgi:hypothetical protein